MAKKAPHYPSVDADGIAQTEADHFMQCPGCGEWFDMRDLGQMIQHVHDAEIEISEGPGAATARRAAAVARSKALPAGRNEPAPLWNEQ